MNRWINYVAVLAVGIIVGAAGAHLWTPWTQPDPEWETFISNHEHDSKHRIVEFQDALRSVASKDSVDGLSKTIATQLEIEGLIIKVKEAEHPQVAVYGSLMVPVIAAAIGALVSLFVAGLGSKARSAR